MIAWILLVIGGLNWGLVFFGYGVGNYLPSGIANAVYILVGLSALYELFTHKSYCKNCSAPKGMGQM